LSASLHQHIARAYRMDVFTNGFVSVLAASQTGSPSEDWFQGTADAVRKCLGIINLERYKRVVILSGDQLYKMNYQELLKTHLIRSADITMGVLPVARDKLSEFGVMRIDPSGRITEFVEKPTEPAVQDELKVDETFARERNFGISDKRWLASMGIYVFEPHVLIEALRDESKIDFGKDVIPASLKKFKTIAHLFDGYWEDIGTIKSFFEANILLGSKNPPFDFFGSEADKIFTKQRFLTASRFMGAHISESVISDGCYFGAGAHITRSVIGIRSHIDERCKIEESIIMGADSAERLGEPKAMTRPGLRPGVVVRRAILDKNVIIGEGAQIINAKGIDHMDGENFCIRDGIVVIPKNTVIPPGTVI